MGTSVRSARRSSRLRASARGAGNPGSSKGEEEDEDFYSVLGVARNARADEIRQRYRELAKVYHPDVSEDEESLEMSVRIIAAYKTLTNPKDRAAYDRNLSSPWGGGNRFGVYVPNVEETRPGTVVGPIVPGQKVMDLQVSGEEEDWQEWVHWLRQWCATFVFGSDVPLPMPAQVDNIEGGARLAFISTASGSIRAEGELLFVVKPIESSEDSADGVPEAYTIQVQRVSMGGEDRKVPGQDVVLKAFQRSLMSKMGGAPTPTALGGLSGLLSAPLTAIQNTVTRLFDNAEDDYNAYVLRPDMQSSKSASRMDQ